MPARLYKTGLAGLFMAACAGAGAARPPAPPEGTQGPRDAVAGAYAGDIAAMQAEIDRHMEEHGHPFYDTVIVLDPDRFDIEFALGRAPRDIVRGMMAERGYNSAWPQDVEYLAAAMHVPDSSLLGPAAYTVSPSAAYDARERVCVILPAPAHAMPVDAGGVLPGMGLAATLEFFNLHEAWHCKDAAYPPAEADRLREQMMVEGVPDDSILSETARRLIAHGYRKEAFADAAATGEMIRRGHGPGVIDAVMRWRSGFSHEYFGHYSVPVLERLRDDIAGMGTGAFRALPEKAAQALYRAATDSAGLFDAEAVRGFFVYSRLAPGERDKMEAQAGGNPGLRSGIAMARDYLRRQPAPVPAPALPGAQAARRAAGEWNALRSLERKAVQIEGRLTRESVARAYAALQRDLRAQIRARPEDPLPREKAMRLRTGLIVALRTKGYPRAASAPAPGKAP